MELKQYTPLAAEALRVARADVAHDGPSTVALTNTTALREARSVDVQVTEAFDGAPSLDIVSSPWTSVPSGTGDNLHDAHRAPDDSLLIGGMDGIRRSTDDGQTWTQAGAAGTRIDTFVTADNGDVIAAGFQNAFFSSDNGATWSALTIGVSATWLTSIKADDGSLVLAGSQGLNPKAAVAVRSTDDGATWSEVTIPLPDGNIAGGGVHAGLKADDGSLVLAGIDGRAVRSTDSGATWSEAPTNGAGLLQAEVLADDGTLIFAGRNGSVTVSTDQGQTWTATTLNSTGNITGAGRDPSGALLLFGVNGSVVSQDNGQSWEPTFVDGAFGNMRTLVEAADGSAIAVGTGGTILRKPSGAGLGTLFARLDAADLARPGLHSLPVRGSVTPTVQFAAGGATQGTATVELTYRT